MFRKIDLNPNFLIVGLIVVCHCFILTHVEAQIHYSNRFTKVLERCRATFISPVEHQYRPKMLKRDDFGRYDQVIESRDAQFEMRFMLDPSYQNDVPNITCLALASSLATNDQAFQIHINIFVWKTH